MKDFVTDAKPTLGKKRDPKTATKFKVDGVPVTFYEPMPGQAAIMMTMGTREINLEASALFIQLFFDLMDDATRRHLTTRLLDADDSFELESKGGIFDIWENLIKEWSSKKAINMPADYQPPRRVTGKQSTGTSRASGSTSSRSRSRASSA